MEGRTQAAGGRPEERLCRPRELGRSAGPPSRGVGGHGGLLGCPVVRGGRGDGRPLEDPESGVLPVQRETYKQAPGGRPKFPPTSPPDPQFLEAVQEVSLFAQSSCARRVSAHGKELSLTFCSLLASAALSKGIFSATFVTRCFVFLRGEGEG